MSKRDESGVTLRELYEQVKRQTGITPEELNGPQFPALMDYVWSAFIRLSNSRNPAFSGASPITYEQIKAFIETTHTYLSPREVDAIKRLDVAYLQAMNS